MPIKLGARPDHGFDEPLGLLSDCHRRIEYFLGVLERIAQQAAGNELKPDQREAVEGALKYFHTAAPRHTRDEEDSLFPLLRNSADPRVREAMKLVESLEREHQVADSAHAEIETLFHEWLHQEQFPENKLGRLTQLLADLVQLYRRHIELEDRQLFPLAGQVLRDEQLQQIGLEMARRRGLTQST